VLPEIQGKLNIEGGIFNINATITEITYCKEFQAEWQNVIEGNNILSSSTLCRKDRIVFL